MPEAEVDFRPGGVFTVCMRMPDGQDFWSKGSYIDISPPERLVFTSGVYIGGSLKFSAHTTVTFEAECNGTRLTVHQTYEIYDESFRSAPEGAQEGWRTTLDKLEKEAARIQAELGRSAVHGAFTIERVYDATPAQVFHALTDKTAKARWFEGGEGYTVVEREMDVRPGGRERLAGRWTSGMLTTFDAVYFDVVANERLVYTYEMRQNERKISVSLATVELKPEGAGVRLTVTEQGVFLDGYLDAGSREHGTGILLDRLGKSLQQ